MVERFGRVDCVEIGDGEAEFCVRDGVGVVV
jgi:hypothetical protein